MPTLKIISQYGNSEILWCIVSIKLKRTLNVEQFGGEENEIKWCEIPDQLIKIWPILGQKREVLKENYYAKNSSQNYEEACKK